MTELATCCEEGKPKTKPRFLKGEYASAMASAALLGTALLLQHVFNAPYWAYFPVYVVSYLLVGMPVLRKAARKLLTADLFNEFFLMSVATLGAFYLMEYPEAVAVMLFYSVGELFQDHAVDRAKRSIEALINVQVNVVTLVGPDGDILVSPDTVRVGDVLKIKPGGKVGLDGRLLTAGAEFNTAALTGESIPRYIQQGQEILAGMISLSKEVTMEVTKLYADSRLSNILQITQEATRRKAPTQKFISKFAKVYTPIVVGLALLIVVVPTFFVSDYVFNDFLYRGLIFLVISCPCALVVSIPLGYFGGIGAASKQGILFKGAVFLDELKKVRSIVFDKTGTLTTGSFQIKSIHPLDNDEQRLVQLAASLEQASSHPVARSIADLWDGPALPVTEIEESPGAGMVGTWEGNRVVVGNRSFLEQQGIDCSSMASNGNAVGLGHDGLLSGYFEISDTLRVGTESMAEDLQKLGISTEILSGDHQEVVDGVGAELKMGATGGMLPDEKLRYIEDKQHAGTSVAFVGDGINDAPVIAAANVGIAMGGLGSDAAIETADVVIQTDQPQKVLTALKIAHATRRIVWQNIGMALGVKIIVMVLGAGGIATLWEAVFADVGVALLAILNASRIQYLK